MQHVYIVDPSADSDDENEIKRENIVFQSINEEDKVEYVNIKVLS